MGKRRRILFATSGTVPGTGREALHAAHVARALAPWYELDILCPMTGRSGHVADFHGARLLRVPLPSGDGEGALALARAVARQVADGVYELVHARTPVEGLPALDLRSTQGYLLVYEPSPPSGLMTGHGTEASFLEAERRLVEQADVVVVHGYEALDRARSIRGPGRAVEHVPAGVDVDVCCPMPLAPPGRGGLLVLEDAAGVKLPVGVECRRLDEPWGPGMWRAEDQAGLALAINSSAACLAVAPPGCPAWMDCMPFGLLEALACQRAVVAPGLPDVVDVVGEDAGRLLYDPSDALSLVRVLDDVLGAGPGLDALVGAVAARVRLHFPASHLRARLLALYASLVPAGGDVPGRPLPRAD
jgi:hypothetical protein